MQNKKRSNLAVFAVLTTITIVIWVLAEGYNRFTKTEIKTVPPKILVPLSASLDKETLDTIEKRRVFSKEEVSSFVPTTTESGPAGEVVERTPEAPSSEEPQTSQETTPAPVSSGITQPSPGPASQESTPPLTELPVLE